MDDFKIIFRQKRVSRHQCSSFEFQRFIGVNWIFQMTNDDSLKLILWLPFSRRVIECNVISFGRKIPLLTLFKTHGQCAS